MTNIEMRIECVECIEDMIEVSRYDDDKFTKLIFFQCPKCKKKISMYVSMYPRCPHGTFGGYKSCMACRPVLMKESKEKKECKFYKEDFCQPCMSPTDFNKCDLVKIGMGTVLKNLD